MVLNSTDTVPGAVYCTRHSLISDQQRAPRSAQQCSWIPNQYCCAWERAVFGGGMPPALTVGWGSVGSDQTINSPRVSSSTHTNTHTHTTNTFSINDKDHLKPHALYIHTRVHTRLRKQFIVKTPLYDLFYSLSLSHTHTHQYTYISMYSTRRSRTPDKQHAPHTAQ